MSDTLTIDAHMFRRHAVQGRLDAAIRLVREVEEDAGRLADRLEADGLDAVRVRSVVPGMAELASVLAELRALADVAGMATDG